MRETDKDIDSRDLPHATETPQRIWNRNFILLFIIQTCDILTYNMVTPVVAKYAVIEGATIVGAGVLAGAFMLVAVFVRPFTGFISDRLNRKALILGTVALGAVALIGYAISPNLQVFLAFRVLHGLAYAVFGTVIAATAFSFLPEAQKGEGMGYFSLSYTIGSALGPAAGVYVGEALGYPWMFGIAGAVLALNLVVGFALPPIQAPQSKSARSAKSEQDAPNEKRKLALGDFISRKALAFMAIMIILCANWSVISTYLILVGDERGVAGIALFFTTNAIALFISRPPAGRFADRHGVKKLVYPAICFEMAAMAALAFANKLWMFVVISVMKAMGHGVIHPALQAECVKQETPERSGVAMSTFLLGTDIGYAVGPMIGALIANHAGYATMYLACVPLTLLAGIIFFLWTRKQKKH